MEIVKGKIEDYIGRATAVAFTCSGSVAVSGKAVLGKGHVRDLAKIIPNLAEMLGEHIRKNGLKVAEVTKRVVAFPSEYSWDSYADIGLIERSAQDLAKLTEEKGWQTVIMPKIGCGGGGLTWEAVADVLDKHLDSRFIILDYAP